MENWVEQWKDIRDFEGVYQISNSGKVKSFKRHKEGYILSIKNKTGDYLTVTLRHGNLVRHEKIHQLVGEAFVHNPDPVHKTQVNHMDVNKQNNNAWNLEWTTPKENIAHAIKMHPNMLKGISDYTKLVRSKPVLQFSMNGVLVRKFANSNEAGRLTGICGRNILQVASKTEYKPGKVRKQAGGFIWKFEDEGSNSNAC